MNTGIVLVIIGLASIASGLVCIKNASAVKAGQVWLYTSPNPWNETKELRYVLAVKDDYVQWKQQGNDASTFSDTEYWFTKNCTRQ